MDLLKEKEIIQRAKRDPQAFGLLFDKYYQPIFGYILRRTANVALAQDLTSQTFLKALKKLKRFKWRNVPFSAWLFRIATNEVNAFYRYQKRHKKILIEDLPEISSRINLLKEVERAEEELKRKEEFLKLHQCISKLNSKYQTVITLRFFEKKKISEISQILGKPEGTIKSQIHRALKELKKLIQE
ncbi:sigma-70 family RNA polymerase sigma factor [bacterium]|nr:sigma-70 family RNA polymerase sigma factor [bacterium]